MPIPLSETEQHLAMKVGEMLQRESQINTQEKSKPEISSVRQKSHPPLSKKIIGFIDELITPKGT